MPTKSNYDDMTRRFLLGESRSAPNIMSYIQSLEEILSRLSPKTVKDSRDMEIAKDHLREIKRHSKKLVERITTLEENKEQ